MVADSTVDLALSVAAIVLVVEVEVAYRAVVAIALAGVDRALVADHKQLVVGHNPVVAFVVAMVGQEAVAFVSPSMTAL